MNWQFLNSFAQQLYFVDILVFFWHTVPRQKEVILYLKPKFKKDV